MEKGLPLMKEDAEPWKVLEFYSGIGGMRYSLMKSGISFTVVEAFEINDKANDVYEHNFSHRPYQGNIQSLTSVELDIYSAHAWLLSPPCQPYTRQGLQRDSSDARASSFLTLLKLIPHMLQPPLILFVENVVGFETSDTHNQMVDIFAQTGFVSQEFILSPLHFGVPYSRPRYFCLAKRKPSSFQKPFLNNRLFWTPSPFQEHETTATMDENYVSSENLETLHLSCEPINNFLDTKISNGYWPENAASEFSDDSYLSPFKNELHLKKGEISSLKELGLRYFTPREVANLHSFPEEFQFPPHISIRQQYALLGNSLSIAVVGPLLHYLFSEPS